MLNHEELDKKYPHAHERNKEILIKQNEIDQIYKNIDDLVSRAKEDYTNAYYHLSQMGAKHKLIHENMATIVKEMKNLEIIVTQPLI